MFSFFVPALDEEENIAATLQTIVSAARESGISPIQIVAIDDGSTDHTGSILQKLQAQLPELEVITHSINQGMAASIRDALRVAKYDRCLFVPGDNDMEKNFLLLMLKYWRSADMVLAFPVNSENRSLFRNVLSYLFRIIYLATFGINVNYVNGPCIYTTEQIRKLKIEAQGFSIISEINTKLLRMGATYCELPGYFQTGSRPRSTVSFKNLYRVCTSYLRLVLEICIVNKSLYKTPPRRIFANLLEPGKTLEV